MKLSKDNKDAIVSSLLVGLAYGLIWGSLVYFLPSSTANALYTGLVAFVIGLSTGLLTTWDTES